MKTNFLLMVSAFLMFGMSLNASITLPKEWNFANDSATWATTATGVTIDPTTIDGLTFGHSAAGGGTPSNLGTITYNQRTYGSVTYNRSLALGGDSYWGALNLLNPKPNQRFMKFDVPGSCIVKMLIATTSSAGKPVIYITDGKTDGTAFIDSIVGPEGKNAGVIEKSVKYIGGATTLYIGVKPQSGVRPEFYYIKVEPYVSSQNYEWNFGLDQTTFPLSGGHAVDTTIDGLTIHPISVTNAGEVTEQTKSFNGTDYIQAFNLGGAGLWGGDFEGSTTSGAPLLMMPRQRYMTFNVSGSCTITAHILARYSGGTGRIFVTDGTNLIGTMSISSITNIAEQSVSYTGEEDKTLYVFGDGQIYFFYMKVEPYDSGIPSSKQTISTDQSEIVSIVYYDLTGRLVTSETKGILLRKATYENGSVKTEKIIIH